MEGAAFASAVTMFDHESRDPHFTKRHAPCGEPTEMRQELTKDAEGSERITCHVSARSRDFASVTPRRHVAVENMFDWSAVASEEELSDRGFNGSVAEMPNRTQREIPARNAKIVSALGGLEGGRFFRLRRVDQ